MRAQARPIAATAALLLLLLLLAIGPVVPATARRALASSSASRDGDGDGHDGGRLEAWPPKGLFLPPELTERDVLVDGLLPLGAEDPQKPGGAEGDNENDASAAGAAAPNDDDDQGTIGRIFSALLARARAQERATPNVGGSANAFTRVEGARTAQRRNATVVLSSGPLNAAALSTAGGAAVAPAGTGLARADARAGASTFANAILSDTNDDPKDFAAAGSSRGSTVAVSGPGNTTRAAGAQTVLGTASAAGERAAQGRAGLGIGPFLVLFNLGSRDGAQEDGGAGSVGIGDKASTRLQVATLAEGRKSEQQVELEKPPPKEKHDEDEHKDGHSSSSSSKDVRDAGAVGAAGADEASTELRTASAPSPPPPGNNKPPGPYARGTARKRDTLAAKAARRKEQQAKKDGTRPEDAAIVEGALSSGRCEEDGGDGKSNSKEGVGEACGKGGGAPYRGGSALRAWADSADAPGLSTTGAGIADVNVRAGLSSEGAANRYGYSRGISTGSAAATGTRAARARVASMSFGTGYVVKSTAATARVVERAEGGGKEKDEKEGKDGGRRRR